MLIRSIKERFNMSNEQVNNETSTSASAADVVAKIDCYTKMADDLVEKALGFVGNHPWEEWLKIANDKIALFLPGVILVMGAIATLVGLISTIKMDAPFSMVVANFGYVILALFSMHLAPRALALSRSFVVKKEADVLRPEFLYILKVLLGVGGLVLAVSSFLTFSAEGIKTAVVLLVFAVLFTVVFARPSVIGVKAGYPSNTAEESITIMLLPVKIVLVLLAPIVAVCTVSMLGYGIYMIFKSGLIASTLLGGGAVVPLVLPLSVYIGYLVFMFWLEICRAIVSLPRRIEGLVDKTSK
jgi:hypothetical protein